VILQFRHKGLETLFAAASARKVPPQLVKRLRLILAALETASVPADMNLQGLRLHPLKGSRRGEWAVWYPGTGASCSNSMGATLPMSTSSIIIE
jgi:proteic killer suppression protein